VLCPRTQQTNFHLLPTCRLLHTIALMLNIKQGSCAYHIFKFLGLIQQGNQILNRSLSIGPFPNRLPVGPFPSLHAPAFLKPKSFWDIWDLSDSFSSHVVLSFHWIPGHTSHAGLPGNEWVDSIAKTTATLPITHVLTLALTFAKIRHTRYSLWR